jgi:cyclase
MRLIKFVVVSWLLLIGFTVTADAQPGTVKQIVPGVWFREGEQRPFGCNNVVIDMKDYLIVVDANYPGNAQALIADVKKISSKPIKYVIDTHGDSDHVYGNVIFTRIGAITIAHAGVVEDMKRHEPQSWQRMSKTRTDLEELNLPGPELPMQTYTNSPYVISDTTRRVELHHFGWGHTRGDTFVYLPKESVLCTGDAVANGPYDDPHYAYMGNWANEVHAAQKLDVKYVLPGHGAAGGKEILEAQRQFFLELYQAVQAAVKQGKTLEQLVTVKDGRPVSTSIQLSKRIMEAYVYYGPDPMPWQISRFPTQVRNTYLEITQGKPYGDIADGK